MAVFLPDEAAFAAAFARLPSERRVKCLAHRFAADRFRSVAAFLALQSLPSARHFSISHSGDWVMAATDDSPIGCDIEEVASFDAALAARCLTDDEYEYVMSEPTDAARAVAFTRLWVRKESSVKLLGTGFTQEPSAYPVWPNAPQGIVFHELEPAAGVFAAVAHSPR